MRLPRPRFTIRLIMIIVAIAAVCLSGGIGAVKLVRRAKHFRQRATFHANLEQIAKSGLALSEVRLADSKMLAERNAYLEKSIRNIPGSSEGSPSMNNLSRQISEQFESSIKLETDWIARQRALYGYHARQKLKYEYAAAHPWESVPPDPPEPSIDLQSPTPPERPTEPKSRPSGPQRRYETEPTLTAVQEARFYAP
jgi:hypothetical protein